MKESIKCLHETTHLRYALKLIVHTTNDGTWKMEGKSVHGERFTSFVCLVESIILGAFAATLASHRSEILDQKVPIGEHEYGVENQQEHVGSYEAPKNGEPTV